MKVDTDNFKQNEILRFMRESTNMSQSDFAKSINKSKDWVRKNEYGLTNYYFKDLILIAKKHGFKITITKD